MDSVHDTPKGWVAPFGHPRIKACSRLPMAFRSVPRPSSPPGAKASTECPSLARNTLPGQPPGASTMHRNHPQITRRRPCRPSGHHPRPQASLRSRHTADLSLSTYPIRQTPPPPTSNPPQRTDPEGQTTAKTQKHPTDRSNAPEHSPRRH
jgi:hypothetical protein